jgi:hypothetical protein
MPIMSCAEWSRDTKRFWFKRSDELTELDDALEEYHAPTQTARQKRDSLRALKNAFDNWTSGKTNAGIDSVRNHRNAVEHLGDQIDEEMMRGGQMLANTGRTALRRHRVAPSATATGNTMTDDAMVSAFADRIRALWNAPSWNSMTNRQCGEAIINAVSGVHTSCGVPNVAPDVKVLDPGLNGVFDFGPWTIELSESLVDFNYNPAYLTHVVDVAETVYHEARHCEQWFHMARYHALGKSAVEVQRDLGIQSLPICDEAKRRQMTHDDRMIALTKGWYESVYGTEERAFTYAALNLRRRDESRDTMNNFHARTHQSYSGGLPEEADAWAIQLLVRAKF